MAGRFRLIGQGDGSEAKVHSPNDKRHVAAPGLLVYTHPYEVGTPLIQFFQDPLGNPNQNVNASGAGTLETVHNGGDTVSWTAQATIGVWDFTSTDQANTGASSIDATNTRNGDIAYFSKGSDLIVTDYSTLRGFIYITSWPSSGSKNFEFSLADNDSVVGSVVQLSSYIDTNSLNSWQLFEIPITDFGISSANFDQLRLDVVDAGQGSAPKAYFDDLAFVSSGTGGSVQYRIAPPVTEEWVINRIKWVAVSNSSSIKYNEFFGLPELANGYTFSFRSSGKVVSTVSANNFFEMAQYPNVTLDIISGTASLFELYFDITAEQQELIGALGPEIVMTVRDDLSSMLEFKATAQGYIRRVI
jgi:hypothetical protein